MTQRTEIARIQSTLKPRFREVLQYTFANDGRFVVVLPYHHGGKLFSFTINSCETPRDYGVKCIHDCGLAFVEQFWALEPMMETGACQDGAPVWLHPNAPLPVFEPLV